MVKTPEQKWKDAIASYRKKCQKIMGVSTSIRYVGAINEYGRTLTGVIKPGVKPLLKSEQAKNEFFIISTLMSLRKNPSVPIGTLNHVILNHQKVSIIAILRDKITFYISIDSKEKGLEKIISKIQKNL